MMAVDGADPFLGLRVRHATDGRAGKNIKAFEKGHHAVEDCGSAKLCVGDVVGCQASPECHIVGQRLFEMA